MRYVHAIGYALAALLAGAVGSSLMGNPTLGERMAICLACAALGAFVGWNRLPKEPRK